MKTFVLEQFSLLKEQHILSSVGKFATWSISCIISAYLLILLAIPLFETSTHAGFVFATDNDGGRAIETSIATRWYNSNHFAPYGNLYYRFSQTAADLVSVNSNELSPTELKEKTHNFTLKLVSLFSLYALGLFLGWILFGHSFLIPLFATLFVLISTKMPMWSEWVFRPHPEHLLNFTIAVAVYIYAKFLNNSENRRLFILSAMAWGLAMAVKRSTSMFIPGILIFSLLPFNKQSVQKTAQYVGYMLLAYLVVGFPQNFGFYKHIKFLMYESSLHSIGDLESITKNLLLTFDQLQYLLPVVLAGVIFSSNKEKIFSLKLMAFVFISFIPILMRKLAFVGDHHTMPMAISTMMLALIFVIHYLPWRINSKWIAAIVILGTIKWQGISPSYYEWKQKVAPCSSEIEEISDIIGKGISSSNKLVKEAYFPTTEKIAPNTSSFWGVDWDSVTSDTKYIGITRNSINSHLQAPPKDFYGKMLERWPAKMLFYNQVNNQNKVISPKGVTYKKIFSGKLCDHELWERE